MPSCPPDRLDVIREGRKGKGRKGLGIGRGKRRLSNGAGRDGKG